MNDAIYNEFDLDHAAIMAFEAELEAELESELEVGTVFTFPKSRRNRTYEVIAILGDVVEYGMVGKPEKGTYSMPIDHQIVKV